MTLAFASHTGQHRNAGQLTNQGVALQASGRAILARLAMIQSDYASAPARVNSQDTALGCG